MRITDIKAAESDLITTLRVKPQDLDARLQLFRCAVIDGNWSRAGMQLDIAEQLEPGLTHTAMVYRRNIACERVRQDIFSGRELPVFLGTPPRWTGYLVQALGVAEAEARAALAHAAFDDAIAIGGTLNGEPFAWLADADNRLGPILEAFVDGKYYWIPFEHISRLTIAAPEDVLDLAWCPAGMTLANGGICHIFIPTRYPCTELRASNDLKLARLTEWLPWSGSLQQGLGQRVFVSDLAEYALLDCREICFIDTKPARPS